MFTATGSPAICVGYVSIFTPSAVTFPPSPPGPMLSLFISFKSSFSSSATYSMLFSLSMSLVSAFFASRAHFSNVPPTPTPTTTGGHAFGPASFTVSITALHPQFHQLV